MSFSRPILTGAALLLAAAALSWRSGAEPPPTPAVRGVGAGHTETAQNGEGTHRLRAEIGELSEEIDALWKAQEAQADLVEEAVAGAVEQEADPELSPDEQAEVLRQTLSATLKEEPVDSAWAPEAQASLQGALQKLGGALTSVDNVECRATLCLVEFEYDAGAIDPAALSESLGQLAPWPNNAVSSIQTTGDHRGWIYLSREGHSLPEA
jgi:hypothetical protein